MNPAVLLPAELAVLATMTAWASRNRRHHVSFVAACGRCHYGVVGLTGTICPECGGDLRRVGIIAGPIRPAAGRFLGLAVAYTLLLAVVGGVLTGLAEAVWPNYVHSTYSAATLTVITVGRTYAIDAAQTAWDGDSSPLPVTLRVSGTGVRPGGAALTAPNGSEVVPATVRHWLRSTGVVDPLSTEVAEVCSAVRGVSWGYQDIWPAELYPKSTFTWSIRTTRRPAQIAGWAESAICLVAWLVGIRLLWRETVGRPS